MFKDLKEVLDEFYNLELTISNNQKVLDKLENDKINLEKKLNAVTNEYDIIKSNTDLMINKRKEMEIKINEMINNINSIMKYIGEMNKSAKTASSFADTDDNNNETILDKNIQFSSTRIEDFK